MNKAMHAMRIERTPNAEVAVDLGQELRREAGDDADVNVVVAARRVLRSGIIGGVADGGRRSTMLTQTSSSPHVESSGQVSVVVRPTAAWR
jgi:hypothetical protein